MARRSNSDDRSQEQTDNAQAKAEPKAAPDPKPVEAVKTAATSPSTGCLVVALAQPARLGSGDRKAGTPIAILTPAPGATLEEARQLINNPHLQKVVREDAK